MDGNLIAAIGAIVVALIEALAARDRKKAAHDRKEAKAAQERAEKHAEIRAKESRLSMKMMDANIQLSVVNANALLGGHNNGNVERAREAAEIAQAEYRAFIQSLAASAVVEV